MPAEDLARAHDVLRAPDAGRLTLGQALQRLGIEDEIAGARALELAARQLEERDWVDIRVAEGPRPATGHEA